MVVVREKVSPNLRFKEFSDEWREKRIGALGDIVTGKTPKTSNIEHWGGDILFITPTDIAEEKKYQRETERTVKGIDKKYVLPTKSILFTCIASIGKMCLSVKPSITNQQINSIVPYSDYDNEYIYYALRSKVSRIKASQANVTLPIINKTDFSKIIINIPSKKEQEKIADFLTTVDEKISKLEEKKNLFEKYKKGVTRAIFSQKIRFKKEDGSSYPEWEEKKLGEIGRSYNGLSGKNADDFGNGSPYITYMQIYENSSIDKSKFEYVKVRESEKQNLVEKDDIFFTTSSETPDEVGISSSILEEVRENTYLNSFCFGYRLNNKVSNLTNFFRFLFRDQKFRKKVFRLAQGSTRFNLSKNELMKLKIDLPSTEEQKIIAEFLTSLDNKIDFISKELEKAKEFKKGLIRQMFI